MAGGLVGAAALGWWSIDRTVIADIRGIESEITAAERDIDALDQHAAALARDARIVAQFRADVLASNAEDGIHRLRLALNDIAQRAGLAEVSVGSRESGVLANPATAAIRALKDAGPGLAARRIAGSLKGRGTPAQAFAALALIEAQPWPKQVGRVTLTPEAGGQSVMLGVELETLALPGAPDGEFVLDTAAVEPHRQSLAATLGASHIFAPPLVPPIVPIVVAPDPVPQPQDEVPRPPPPPPHHEWRATALVERAAAPELWLTNTKTGQTVILTPGQSHLGAVFAGVNEGLAMIEVGSERFALSPGECLHERHLLTPAQ